MTIAGFLRLVTIALYLLFAAAWSLLEWEERQLCVALAFLFVIHLFAYAEGYVRGTDRIDEILKGLRNRDDTA